MTLTAISATPFLAAPVEILVHASAASLALVLGPLAIYRKTRDRLHKVAGYAWVLAMFMVAVSAFFIEGFAVIGPFSPLHGFAILTLWSLFEGMRHIFAGRIAEHRAVFRSLYWNGLLIAGMFNFLPGRMVNRMLFGGNEQLGWVVIGAGAVFLAARALRPVLSRWYRGALA